MLEATFPIDAIPAEAALAVCLKGFDTELQKRKVKFYGRALDSKALEREVRAARHFKIEVQGWTLIWAGVSGYEVALFDVQNAPMSAEERLLGELSGLARLITGRWYDQEYERWQNATDPIAYKVANRSIEGLSMRCNDLPPPLRQMVVDTSRNPGRREIRRGYVEAIGHRMWLGPEFFARLCGVSREVLRSTSWLAARDLDRGVLEIVVSPEPFRDTTTADLQDRLRALLFPTVETLDGRKN